MGRRTEAIAKLATVRPDGRPHVAPVWFDLDGNDLVFSTGERSVKGRNLIADRRLSICVDDEQRGEHQTSGSGRGVLRDAHRSSASRHDSAPGREGPVDRPGDGL
jgi:pyridoxine/pyridoxamine 5'-phosphate oxidase